MPVRAASDLELWQPQSLSIACFRHRPPGLEEEALDGHNRRLLEAIQLGGEAFLSGTTLGGRFYLRACIVNHRSSAADIDILLEEVRRRGQEVHRE